MSYAYMTGIKADGEKPQFVAIMRELLGYENDKVLIERNAAELNTPTATARKDRILAAHTVAVEASWGLYKSLRREGVPIDTTMARTIAAANFAFENEMTIIDRVAPDALITRLAGQAVLKTAAAHVPLGADASGHLKGDEIVKRPRGRPPKGKKH